MEVHLIEDDELLPERTEYAAQRQILDGYSAQIQKVNDLKGAYISASQAAKQSSLAASIFGAATSAGIT